MQPLFFFPHLFLTHTNLSGLTFHMVTQKPMLAHTWRCLRMSNRLP